MMTKELIEEVAEEYGIGEAENEDNIDKSKINIAIDGFIEGANFAGFHYQMEITELIQKINGLTNQIGEILGGVPQGTSYIIRN